MTFELLEMFDLKNFSSAITQIAEEKGIAKEKIIETIEQAIAAAYKKEYRKKNEIIRAKMDTETGEVKFWQVKIVVEPGMLKEEEAVESETVPEREEFNQAFLKEEVLSAKEGEKKIRFNADRHILLEEAQEIKPEVLVGEEVIFPLESHEDFGRIAAQTAKQVILQRLREAEREAVLSEYKDKEGEIISGIVQRIENRNVFINLGRAQGVMFYNESIPGERYRIGERMKFYILAVQEDNRGTMIILSRSHPKFISKLFELEVPEIASGTVKVMSIAREAGFRTKIAVHSTIDGIDPIGSCVGQKGTRVMAVLSEIGQEKIDIIKWSEDAEKFVAQSLSPAKASRVEIKPRREVRVFVPEDQLSLAIGRGGQNVRLAAKLTGWKIDVRSESAPEKMIEGGIAEAELPVVTEEKLESAEAQKPFFGLSDKIVKSLTKAGYDEEKVKKATKDELMELEGIGEKTAEKIIDLASQA